MNKRNNGLQVSKAKPIFYFKNINNIQIKMNDLISIFGIHRGIAIHKNRITHPELFEFPFLSYLFYSSNRKNEYEQNNISYTSKVKRIINSVSLQNQKNEYCCDKLISFNHSTYFSNKRQRFNRIHRNTVFEMKGKIITKMQRAIKFFLLKIFIKNSINQLINQKTQTSVIKIQCNFRRYSTIKQIKKCYLLYIILSTRYKSCSYLRNLIIKYHNKVKYKAIVIYKSILCFRRYHIVKIQNKYRTHYLSKLVQEIIAYEKTQYIITYPFKAKEVFLKMYLNSNLSPEKYHFFSVKNETRQFQFYYCTLRKIFILYINKYEIIQGKYRCQFIVDGQTTCDGRYSYTEYTDGNYYNILEFNTNDVDEQEDNSRNTRTDIGSESSCV